MIRFIIIFNQHNFKEREQNLTSYSHYIKRFILLLNTCCVSRSILHTLKVRFNAFYYFHWTRLSIEILLSIKQYEAQGFLLDVKHLVSSYPILSEHCVIRYSLRQTSWAKSFLKPTEKYVPRTPRVYKSYAL